MSAELSRSGGGHNLSEYTRPGRDSHFGHNQSEIDLHGVHADLHVIRDLLAGKPEQQELQNFSFSLRELELLTHS